MWVGNLYYKLVIFWDLLHLRILLYNNLWLAGFIYRICSYYTNYD